MRILVVGAYGFIGRGVVLAFLRSGAEVIGAGRDLALGRRLLPEIEWIFTDFNRDLEAVDWAERLDQIEGGVDAIVNCVGILQSDFQDKAKLVHGVGARALFKGAEMAGVRRLIHISAATIEGGDELPLSGYAASKLAGEAALAETKLDWVIVRPDLVLGQGSYGGALMLQGLAGLPFVIPVPHPGLQKFQPIALHDLADGIVRLCEDENQTYKRKILYAVGPEVLRLSEIIQHYRRWLGFGPARLIYVPRFLVKVGLWVGDFVALFGNRGAFRSTSLVQMERFAAQDPREFENCLGRPLSTLALRLAAQPAGMPERQYARTAFVWPLLQWVLGLSWIVSGFDHFIAEGLAGFDGFQLRASFASIEAGLSILCGGLFLSKKWLRIGGLVKMGLILIAGGISIFYVDGLSSGVHWGLGFALPLLVIALVMGMSERR